VPAGDRERLEHLQGGGEDGRGPTWRWPSRARPRPRPAAGPPMTGADLRLRRHEGSTRPALLFLP
jgi:hypothetical protein